MSELPVYRVLIALSSGVPDLGCVFAAVYGWNRINAEGSQCIFVPTVWYPSSSLLVGPHDASAMFYLSDAVEDGSEPSLKVLREALAPLAPSVAFTTREGLGEAVRASLTTFAKELPKTSPARATCQRVAREAVVGEYILPWVYVWGEMGQSGPPQPMLVVGFKGAGYMAAYGAIEYYVPQNMAVVCGVAPAITHLPLEQRKTDARFTCTRCDDSATCEFAWDEYNTDGDCLASK